MNGVQEILADGWFDEPPICAPLGEGHINQTLLVTDRAGERFVLQRINEQVFTDPALVMTNLQRIRALADAQVPGMIPDLLPIRSGDLAWWDEVGGWWRLWRFVEGTRSLNQTVEPSVAHAAGGLFGRFQKLLSRLEGPRLEPTIPGFLQLGHYLERLDQLLSQQPEAARALHSAGGDAGFLAQHRQLIDRFPPATGYIHGDCKLNNLLFAADHDEAVTVLDLDTVMWGHWAWDFGDLTRSVLMGSGNLPTLFAAVVNGFCSGSGRRPLVVELVQAPVYVTFMLGVRFLTDHLEGDRYFTVAARGDNLIRAREQFELVGLLDDQRRNLESAAADGLREADALTEYHDQNY